MMLQNRFRRFATLILAAAMTTLLVPGLVLAHAELVTPTPADKAVVPPPVSEVSGVYSEAMTPTGSSLVVKNTSGATVASGTVDPDDNTRMVATPATPLTTGTYNVEWTSVALDGHVERGTWTFDVGIAAPTVSAASSSAAPSAAPTTASVAPATPLPSVAPTPVPSADGSTTGSSGDVILPIVIALIVLGAGAAYLLSRRNRPPDPL